MRWTELTSAIATLELENGKHRSSKKLFNLSLDCPNENSIAQAQWVSRVLPGVDLSRPANPIPRAFEADGYRSFYAQNWDHAFQAVWTGSRTSRFPLELLFLQPMLDPRYLGNMTGQSAFSVLRS